MWLLANVSFVNKHDLNRRCYWTIVSGVHFLRCWIQPNSITTNWRVKKDYSKWTSIGHSTAQDMYTTIDGIALFLPFEVDIVCNIIICTDWMVWGFSLDDWETNMIFTKRGWQKYRVYWWHCSPVQSLISSLADLIIPHCTSYMCITIINLEVPSWKM